MDKKKNKRAGESAVPGYDEGFKNRINSVLTEIGTLKDAGEIAGVSDEQIANWRDGKSKPSFFGMSALAGAAGVSVQWLATGEGEKTPPKIFLKDGYFQKEIVWNVAYAIAKNNPDLIHATPESLADMVVAACDWINDTNKDADEQSNENVLDFAASQLKARNG